MTIREVYRHIFMGFKSPEIISLFTILIGILFVGTAFYHYVEDWGWFDSFYFSAMTLTTVGYGDFAPGTAIGKLFTIMYVFSGLGIVLTFVQTVARKQATDSWFTKLIKSWQKK